MQGGSEGDEIILNALRQIECTSIGTDVITIAQLTPAMLVEAVAKSLLLITEGKAKFPTVLPPNIATQHRVCTNMATKVKELGFPQQLGYNQLLYPALSTTKELLIWLVQKLPRQEEDGAEAAMGPHAVRNARITEALTKWVQTTWKLHFCTTSGVNPRNLYTSHALRTVSGKYPIFYINAQSVDGSLHVALRSFITNVLTRQTSHTTIVSKTILQLMCASSLPCPHKVAMELKVQCMNDMLVSCLLI